jgi:hypothetical protein
MLDSLSLSAAAAILRQRDNQATRTFGRRYFGARTKFAAGLGAQRYG